jgi:hypothetical protein
MAKEKFEDRRLEGNINVACKFQDGTVRPIHKFVSEFLEQRKKVMRDQWVKENEEMYKNTPKI